MNLLTCAIQLNADVLSEIGKNLETLSLLRFLSTCKHTWNFRHKFENIQLFRELRLTYSPDALRFAIQSGDMEIIRLFISLAAPVDEESLYLACAQKIFELLPLLVANKKYASFFCSVDECWASLLKWAAKKNDIDTAVFTLRYCKNFTEGAYTAIQNCSWEVADIILEHSCKEGKCILKIFKECNFCKGIGPQENYLVTLLKHELRSPVWEDEHKAHLLSYLRTALPQREYTEYFRDLKRRLDWWKTHRKAMRHLPLVNRQ